MLYILDTHVLIGYFIGSTRLTRAVKEKIDEVRSTGGRLLVPTIVLAEALSIAEKGKVAFDFPALYHRIKAEPEFEIISFTSEILEEVTALAIPEIHDRIIVATARFYQCNSETIEEPPTTSSPFVSQAKSSFDITFLSKKRFPISMWSHTGVPSGSAQCHPL